MSAPNAPGRKYAPEIFFAIATLRERLRAKMSSDEYGNPGSVYWMNIIEALDSVEREYERRGDVAARTAVLAELAERLEQRHKLSSYGHTDVMKIIAEMGSSR